MADRTRLMSVLSREFPSWGNHDKFEWLYLRNPFGQAQVWTLEDEHGEIVGVSSAFPRTLRVGEREIAGWVLGDFCVARAHRSLGPAIQLQRAAFEAVEQGEVGAFYDFPSRTMVGVYRRMGVTALDELVRLVRPLRIDRALEQRIPSRLLARGLSIVGNAALDSRDRWENKASDAGVVHRRHVFGALERVENASDGVTILRSSPYLKWRYYDDPRGSASLLVAAREDSPSACVAYRRTEDAVTIVDCFGDPSDLPELLSVVVEEARAGSAEHVSVALSSAHPWLRAFERAHFHRRDSAPFVVHVGGSAFDVQIPWILTSGDRDL